jgi:hypothetical protein
VVVAVWGIGGVSSAALTAATALSTRRSQLEQVYICRSLISSCPPIVQPRRHERQSMLQQEFRLISILSAASCIAHIKNMKGMALLGINSVERKDIVGEGGRPCLTIEVLLGAFS